MKYLVIGDAGSMHIFNFVKTVLLPREYEVHLLTLSAKPVRGDFRAFYRDNGIHIHSIAEKGYTDLKKKGKYHRTLHFLRKLRLMREIPKVDVCHVHSVYKTACLMTLLYKRKYKKLILSYWGGDIEDRTKSVVKIRKKCFKKASVITVTVQQTYQEFREIYGDKYDDKLRVCRFATDGLNCIMKLSQEKTRRDCRELYEVPEGKICITCGYSAYREQHQDECLKTIGSLPKHVRDRLFVIVPMQYGREDEEYKNKVRNLAKEIGVECRILEEFVPFEISAQLAMATDIYLHIRDTDAFSNALKEHVFSGSYIIKGDWLKYPELTEMKAPIASIPSLDKLGETLIEILDNFEVCQEFELFMPIYQLYATESIKKQWSDVIEFAMNSDKE